MKISVVTVCFNAEQTIAHTLASISSQSNQDIEHIVVDGGSRDHTVETIKANAGAHIRWISEKDRGIYDAMNKGIKMASGEVIGFLNADDFYPSQEILAKVAKVFEDERVDACYADLCYVSQEDESKVIRYWRSSAIPKDAFVNSWVPAHPTFFVRKSVYDRLGGFDLDFKIAADFELMLRFLGVNKIKSVYVPEVWVHMRLGGETNKSISNIIRQNREIVAALRKHGLAVNMPSFLIKKIISRVQQYVGGWRKA